MNPASMLSDSCTVEPFAKRYVELSRFRKPNPSSPSGPPLVLQSAALSCDSTLHRHMMPCRLFATAYAIIDWFGVAVDIL